MSKSQTYIQSFLFLLFIHLFLGCGDKTSSDSIVERSSYKIPEGLSIPTGMVYVPGGNYIRGNEQDLGTTSKFPEEKPEHEVYVDAFLMDETEVTNRDFKQFVDETGYQTFAERGLSRQEFPHAPDDQLLPGSTVFYTPDQNVEMWQRGAENQWWKFTPGANWMHPNGPESSISDKMDHPVVAINIQDAQAYAKWAGKRLPTEAEWERAARAGKNRLLFIWGNESMMDGKWMANCFQGQFPTHNSAKDGFSGTAPVKSFPPNDFGLYDMAGNVWEMCSDFYRHDAYSIYARKPVPNPKGPLNPIDSFQNQMIMQGQSIGHLPKPAHPLMYLYVSRGGSFLCHHSYCLRYRPAARQYIEGLSPTNHIGFRLVKDLPDK